MVSQAAAVKSGGEMRNTVLTNIFKSPNKMTIILERGQFLQQGGGLMEKKGVTPSHGDPVTSPLL